MKSLRRRWWLVTGLALVGLLAAFVLEERLRGEWALRAWKRELRRQGRKLTVDELTPQRPTNAQTRVVSSYEAQSLWMLGGAPLDSPAVMVRVAPGQARSGWKLDTWERASGRGTNTWDEFGQQFAVTRKRIPALRADLTNRAFLVELNYHGAIETVHYHLSQLRTAAQCLVADCVLSLHEGQLNQAFEDLAALQSLVAMQRDERMILSQLVRVANLHLAVGATWEALQADGWSEAQLGELQRQYQSHQLLLDLGRTLEMDRAMGEEWWGTGKVTLRLLLEQAHSEFGAQDEQRGLRALAQSGPWGEMVAPLAAAGAALRTGLMVGLWRVAWVPHYELFRGQVTEQVIQAAQAAAKERHWKSASPSRPVAGSEIAWSPKWDWSQFGRYDRQRYWLAGVVLGSMQATCSRVVKAESVKDLAVTAMALKRFQVRHGTLPKELAGLVPEFLDQVPRDLWDGRPLRYTRLTDGAYRLYSIGEDRRDDGGDAEAGRDVGRPKSLLTGRDIVWPQCVDSK